MFSTDRWTNAAGRLPDPAPDARNARPGTNYAGARAARTSSSGPGPRGRRRTCRPAAVLQRRGRAGLRLPLRSRLSGSSSVGAVAPARDRRSTRCPCRPLPSKSAATALANELERLLFSLSQTAVAAAGEATTGCCAPPRRPCRARRRSSPNSMSSTGVTEVWATYVHARVLPVPDVPLLVARVEDVRPGVAVEVAEPELLERPRVRTRERHRRRRVALQVAETPVGEPPDRVRDTVVVDVGERELLRPHGRAVHEPPGLDACAGVEPRGAVGEEDVRAAVAVEVARRRSRSCSRCRACCPGRSG